MSAYYSRFGLNTYLGTPYFQSQIPQGYPLQGVLQKCKAFRRLPPNIKRLSKLSKRWAEKKPSFDSDDIDSYYDAQGYELDPDTGRRLTDAEVDASWTPNPNLDGLTVTDIPVPDGGFADPDTWEEPTKKEKPKDSYRPTEAQLLKDIGSRGIKAAVEEYGIPEEEMPEGAVEAEAEWQRACVLAAGVASEEEPPTDIDEDRIWGIATGELYEGNQ